MTGPEILPAGSDGLDYTERKTFTPDRGDGRTESWSGPKASVEAKYDEFRAGWKGISYFGGLSMSNSRGRGTVDITYAKSMAIDTFPSDEGVQELLQVDVVRAIYLAPYFAGLSSYDIQAVRKAFEDQAEADAGWVVLQNELFGHLLHGQEEYYETAYIFRQTFRTNSTTIIRKSASNPNTVQDLPKLSSRLKNQIDSLPAGEWLKRPTQVRYLGKDGTDVSQEYHWAPQWSVIYGGTFTGLPL